MQVIPFLFSFFITNISHHQYFPIGSLITNIFSIFKYHILLHLSIISFPYTPLPQKLSPIFLCCLPQLIVHFILLLHYYLPLGIPNTKQFEAYVQMVQVIMRKIKQVILEEQLYLLLSRPSFCLQVIHRLQSICKLQVCLICSLGMHLFLDSSNNKQTQDLLQSSKKLKQIQRLLKLV